MIAAYHKSALSAYNSFAQSGYSIPGKLMIDFFVRYPVTTYVQLFFETKSRTSSLTFEQNYQTLIQAIEKRVSVRPIALYNVMEGIIQRSKNPPSPQYMFFYGTLMDPKLLQTVACLDLLPKVRKATLKGFKLMMWGEIFPTLLPALASNAEAIPGVVWKVESQRDIALLSRYETEAYKLSLCDVQLEDGEVLKGCGTYCWAGEEDDPELEEGKFDLWTYQQYFGPFGAHH